MEPSYRFTFDYGNQPRIFQCARVVFPLKFNILKPEFRVIYALLTGKGFDLNLMISHLIYDHMVLIKSAAHIICNDHKVLIKSADHIICKNRSVIML